MTFTAADVNRLMDNARVSLPGALDGAVQLELFNVLNEFFQKTNIWTEDITFVVAGGAVIGSTVTITPTAGLINRLMYVLNSNQQYRGMAMATPGILQYSDVPTVGETWTARVALTVTDPIAAAGTAPGLPEAPAWVLSKYNNGILDGILGRMMAQTSKPYSNARMAIVRSNMFKNAVSHAKSEAQHQNLYRGQAWKFPGPTSGSQRSRGT